MKKVILMVLMLASLSFASSVNPFIATKSSSYAIWDTTGTSGVTNKIFGQDSLYVLKNSGRGVFYIKRLGAWTKICSLTTTSFFGFASSKTVKAKDGDLYILQDSVVYKIPHIWGNALTTVINSAKVAGFYIDLNDKIWFTSSNSTLYRCDLNGSNVLSIKSLPMTGITQFAVNADTAVAYGYGSNELNWAIDKYNVILNSYYITDVVYITSNMNSVSADQNGDFWIILENQSDFNYIYKYDIALGNFAKWKMRSNTFNHTPILNLKTTNEFAYEGKGDTIFTYNLNNKPKFITTRTNDSIGYTKEQIGATVWYDERNKKISYSCSLKVLDDNAADIPTYIGLSQPTWLTIVSANSHNAAALCTAKTDVPIDTGTYLIKILVKDGWTSGNEMSDTIQWNVKVYSKRPVVTTTNPLNTIDNKLTTFYSQAINLYQHDGNSVKVVRKNTGIYATTLPMVPFNLDLIVSNVSTNNFLFSGTMYSTVPTGTANIKIVFADSSSMMKDSLAWTINETHYNITHSPTVILDTNCTEGSAYSTIISFNDSVYVTDTKIPNWLTYTRNAYNQYRFSGIPNQRTGDTSFYVIFRGCAITYDTVRYNLHITHIAHPVPHIVSSIDSSAYKGIQYSLTIITNDSSYMNAIVKPSWITLIPINRTSIELRGTPTSFTNEIVKIQLRSAKVEDNNYPAYDTVTYTIHMVNRKPVISNNDTTITMYKYDSVNIVIHSQDLDGQTLTYTNTAFNLISNQDSTFTISPNHNSIDTVYLIVSDGQLTDSCRVILTINTKPTSILPSMVRIPLENYSSPNYPNPFNPVTSINYGVKEVANVSIGIYNLNGQLIKNVLNDKKDAGIYSVVWNGMDNNNKSVHSGTYIYKVKIGNEFIKIQKMTMVK